MDYFFALLPPQQPWKSKFWKNEKNTCRYYHFTLVCHKWQLHDVWFLRYGAQKTEFFPFLDIFCPITTITTQKVKVLKKQKKRPRDIIILHRCTINENHMMNEWFLRYGAPQKEFFLTLDNFLPLPPNNWASWACTYCVPKTSIKCTKKTCM